LGAHVDYSDPFIPAFPPTRHHHFDLRSIKISKNALSEYDCVLLATNHDGFDYETIKEHSKLIVDTRGHYREAHEKIIRA